MLGERLREQRQRAGLTMKELGAKFGLAESTISGYENGHREPAYDVLRKFADYFGCTVDYLLGRSLGQTSHLSGAESLLTNTVDGGNLLNKSLQRSQQVIDKAISKMHTADQQNNMGDARVKMIPVLGVIRAGYDLYAEQQVIGMEPALASAVEDGEYFYLAVTGDSMIEEGIREGMKVLVRRQPWVEDGKIGVVLINGDEATLKRVISKDGELVLLSSNAKYPPRNIPVAEARIQGQVKQVVWDV